MYVYAYVRVYKYIYIYIYTHTRASNKASLRPKRPNVKHPNEPYNHLGKEAATTWAAPFPPEEQ